MNNLRSTTPELRSDTKVLNRPPVRLRRSAHLSFDAERESRSRQRTGIGAPASLPRSSGSRLSPRLCQSRFGAVTKRTHGTTRCRRCCLPSRFAFAGGLAIQRREPRNLTELQSNRDQALDAVGLTQLPGSIGTDHGHVREYFKPHRIQSTRANARKPQERFALVSSFNISTMRTGRRVLLHPHERVDQSF